MPAAVDYGGNAAAETPAIGRTEGEFMIVGILTVEIHLPESESLKAKRFVIKSLKDRLRQKFNISVAEEGNNLWQRVSLSIACVSGDTRHVNSTLETVKNMIEREPSIEVLDFSMEIL